MESSRTAEELLVGLKDATEVEVGPAVLAMSAEDQDTLRRAAFSTHESHHTFTGNSDSPNNEQGSISS